MTKADNGFFHSLAFTVDDFSDPIRIKPRNARIAQNSCLDCHADAVHSMQPVDDTQEALSCVHCHASVGHALR
jgi:cytochrome c nitrite reductase small subunit